MPLIPILIIGAAAVAIFVASRPSVTLDRGRAMADASAARRTSPIAGLKRAAATDLPPSVAADADAPAPATEQGSSIYDQAKEAAATADTLLGAVAGSGGGSEESPQSGDVELE